MKIIRTFPKRTGIGRHKWQSRTFWYGPQKTSRYLDQNQLDTAHNSNIPNPRLSGRTATTLLSFAHLSCTRSFYLFNYSFDYLYHGTVVVLFACRGGIVPKVDRGFLKGGPSLNRANGLAQPTRQRRPPPHRKKSLGQREGSAPPGPPSGSAIDCTILSLVGVEDSVGTTWPSGHKAVAVNCAPFLNASLESACPALFVCYKGFWLTAIHAANRSTS